MVSLDALIDSCGMLFGAMVYHWWVIHDYGHICGGKPSKQYSFIALIM
jgi:hypothetical protein